MIKESYSKYELASLLMITLAYEYLIMFSGCGNDGGVFFYAHLAILLAMTVYIIKVFICPAF